MPYHDCRVACGRWQIAPDMPNDYRRLLEVQRYQGAIVLVATMDRSLVDNYWLSLPEHDIPLVVALEHTNFIEPEHYQGKRILYLSNYVSPEHPQFHMSKEELLELYEPTLRRLNPAFRSTGSTRVGCSKTALASPCLTSTTHERIPSHRQGSKASTWPTPRSLSRGPRSELCVRLGGDHHDYCARGTARARVRW